MREIKFRGKTVSGEWVYGNLTVLRQTIHNVERGSYISNDAGMPFAYQVIPETVGQYISLKDTNGTDVYEGDIIKDCFTHPDPDNLDDKYLDDVGKGIIVWYKCGFWIRVENQLKPSWPRHHQIILEWIKVIGNIHENPGLLDVEP